MPPLAGAPPELAPPPAELLGAEPLDEEDAATPPDDVADELGMVDVVVEVVRVVDWTAEADGTVRDGVGAVLAEVDPPPPQPPANPATAKQQPATASL